MQVCDQKCRRRFTRKKWPTLPVLVIVPLNFFRFIHPTHENSQVKSSLKLTVLMSKFIVNLLSQPSELDVIGKRFGTFRQSKINQSDCLNPSPLPG